MKEELVLFVHKNLEIPGQPLLWVFRRRSGMFNVGEQRERAREGSRERGRETRVNHGCEVEVAA